MQEKERKKTEKFYALKEKGSAIKAEPGSGSMNRGDVKYFFCFFRKYILSLPGEFIRSQKTAEKRLKRQSRC